VKRRWWVIGAVVLATVGVGAVTHPCWIPGAPYTCRQYEALQRYSRCYDDGKALLREAKTAADSSTAEAYLRTC
jgi:hypothetical protein